MTQTKAFYNFQIGEGTRYEAQEDGSLYVRGVLIMGAGDWVSAQGMKTRFSAEVLKKYATNWSDNPLWLRHAVGTSRGINEIVGAVTNQHFDPAFKTVLPDGRVVTTPGCVGDLYLNGRTPESRTAIELVQLPETNGGVKAISAETFIDTKPAGDGWLDVTLINFYGAALVRRGACEACRLPAFQAGHGVDEMDDDPNKEKNGQQDPAKGGDPKQQNPDPGAMLAEVHAMCKDMQAGMAAMLEAMKGSASAEAAAHEAMKGELAKAKLDLGTVSGQFEALKGEHAKLQASYQEIAKKAKDPATFQHNEQADMGAREVPEITRRRGDLVIKRQV